MCGNCDGIKDTLKTILKLQKKCSINSDDMSCDRPFLGGGDNTSLNTRPISLYTCPTNTLWTMPYGEGETAGTSTVFRIEKIGGCCATFRVLSGTDGAYEATNSFFTINLNCVGAMRCLSDTFVPCI